MACQIESAAAPPAKISATIEMTSGARPGRTVGRAAEGTAAAGGTAAAEGAIATGGDSVEVWSGMR
jgi:hypothetical protein